MGAEEDKRNEAVVEESRPKPQPMTEAQFLSWKRHKDADVSARKAESARKRAEDIAAGIVQMNDSVQEAEARNLGQGLSWADVPGERHVEFWSDA